MERNHTIDFLKFFAMFFILCIHTNPFSSFKYGDFTGQNIHFTINVLARFGVPFFFIVSGYLLGQKLANSNYPSHYFKQYLLKLIKLLIFWTLFFVLYDLVVIVLKSMNNTVNMKLEIIKYLDKVLKWNDLYYGINDASSFHLWYLVALVWSLIILYPFIKMGKIKWLLFTSFILYTIGLFGQSYSIFFPIPLNTRDCMFFGLFYVAAGYYLATNKTFEKLKIKSYWFFLLFLLFSLLQVGESRLLVKYFQAQWGDYYIFTLPAVASLILFLLNNPGIKVPFINKMGANSVGIYVIHVLFLKLHEQMVIYFHLNITNTFIWNLLFTPFLFILSYYSYILLLMIKNRVISKPIEKENNMTIRPLS